MNKKDTIEQLVRLEKDFHHKRLTKIVEENIGLDKESTYFYECRGSGYYLKYNTVSGETIILDVYSKGGIKKKDKFYLHWYGVDCLKKLD